jgi:hypothetical protein
VASNGLIYCVPFSFPSILILNPQDDTIQLVDITGVQTALSSRWFGACVGVDGLIYCVPNSDDNILVIDPSNNSISTIPSGTIGVNKWRGGYLHSNGSIYCAPGVENSVLRIDTTMSPATASLVGVGTFSGSTPYFSGGATNADGQVVFVPSSQNRFAYIDLTGAVQFPVAPTTSVASPQFLGANLARDGRIYAAGL